MRTRYVNYSVVVATVNINGTGPFSNPVVGRSGEDGELSIIRRKYSNSNDSLLFSYFLAM